MKQVRVIVKKEFRDLKDENHIYRVGENYPFHGPVDPVRTKELASNENKLGEPLLEVLTEEVDFSELGIIEEPKEEVKKTTRTKKVADSNE